MQILGLAFGIEVFWVSRSDHTDSRRGSHLDTCFAQGLFQVLQPCPPREGRFDRPPREAQASSSEFRVSGNITASKSGLLLIVSLPVLGTAHLAPWLIHHETITVSLHSH